MNTRQNRLLADHFYLAEASYADFSQAKTGNTSEYDGDIAKDAMKKKKKEGGIEKPRSLADLVFNNYKIAAHWKDRENESSFSGTLFKNITNENNENSAINHDRYILALKGTLETKDFSTDGGDIVLDGLAHHQIVDLYNFWQQITHKGEYKVAQIISGEELENLKKEEEKSGIYTKEGYFKDTVAKGKNIDPAQFNGTLNTLTKLIGINPAADAIASILSSFETIEKRIVFKNSHEVYAPDDERYDGLGINPGKVTVTGHSLGGHLAAAFSRLFPEVTEHAYMINGAGFGQRLPGVAENIKKIFKVLGGQEEFDKDKITNFIGDKNMDFVAQDWFVGLKQPGVKHELFIENGFSDFSDDVWGHGMGQMNDTMSVMALFASLDNKLDDGYHNNFVECLNKVFEEAAATGRGGAERIVNQLAVQLLGKDPKIQKGDREAIFRTVSELQTKITNEKEGLEHSLIATPMNFLNQDNIKLAHELLTGMGYRYALKHLNPFSLSGDKLYNEQNGLLKGEVPTLEFLDINDKSTYAGMTEEYIKHRLNMLQLLSNNQREDRYSYRDIASGLMLDSNMHSTNTNISNIRFGTDGDDKLIDYGGDGYIFAGKGNDILSGGSGRNYLEGGTGHDTYQFKTNNSGVNTIFDADGDGVLEVDGTLLSRLEFVGAPMPFSPAMKLRWTPFRTRDGQYQFLKYDDDQWEFSVRNASGNYKPLARIRHWKEGDFGFTLAEDNSLLSEEGGSFIDDSGKAHLFFYNGVEAPRGIRVKGSNIKPSQITGSAHDDVLFTGDGGTKGLHLVMAGLGNDFVYGGNNQEFIFSGNLHRDATNDNDTVYAGGGSDIVIGGAGSDTLVAGNGKEDFETPLPDDETNTETASRQGKRGDWLNGHFGSGVIIGSARDDVLTGGEGDDTIRGGAGNDLFLGDANYLPTTSSVSLGTAHNAAEGTIIERHWPANGSVPRPLDGSLSVPGEKTFAWEWQSTETDFKIMPGIRLMLQEREQGTGDDALHGGAGNDWMDGQAGKDTLYAGSGKDKLHGGAGNDVLDASDDDNDKDELSGDEGDDQLKGGTGGDELNGGAGNDVLRAGKDKTLMDGGIDNDIYFGNSGDDTMTDQDGDDHYYLSPGMDDIKDFGMGHDGYHISFTHLMPPGVTTIHDSNGKGFITYNGSAITNDGVRAVAENEWVTDTGAKLVREGSKLVITNGPKGSQGKVVFTGFFNSEEFLGLKLPPLHDDNKPEPKPEPQPKQPQAPTAGKPLAAQSIHEKDKLSYTLAEDTFHTANQDDKLSYSARLADGKPLPKWLNFDAATRTFSGTPGNDDVGTLDIEISVQGKGGSASQHLALNVINVNDAPQIDAAIAAYTGENGKPLQYRIPANAFKDIDKDDTLTLSAKLENGEPLPSWLTFDEKTGQFSGTPPSAHTANTWRIAVTATDNAGAQVSQTFSLITTAAATNIIQGTGKESIIQGTSGNDTIYVGDNPLQGGHYKEVYGNDGDDVIYSGSGRDHIHGGAGNDILYAGTIEHDGLYGGYGDDIYRIGADFREVSIENYDLDQYDWRPQRRDIIEFAAHKRDDFNIFNYGDNLYLKTRDGKEVGIYDQFSNQGDNWHYINEIRFTDKTLTAEDIKAMRINGTAGDDTLSAKAEGSWLYGKQGNDHLFSGQGNDYLDGGVGSDTYHFARGFGYDLINNENYGSRYDSIVFSDMNRDDFDIYRENTSLVLRSKDGKDQITVRNHFQLSWQIDSIRFADGTTLNHDAINSAVSTPNAPRGNYTHPAAQALQMNQAIASLNSQAQPLDALATPDLQPRPLLAAGNP